MLTAFKIIGILARLLFNYVIINVFNIRFLKYFNSVLIILNSINIFSVAVIILIVTLKYLFI